MPQMAPLSWYPLMIATITLMITMMTMLFFHMKMTPNFNKKKSNPAQNWKW